MPDADPIKILVVDDLQDKLLVYRTVLESPSLEIVTATSGQEALRQVLQDEFAVILLDVNMPGMDGYETAEMIRKRKRSSHTPIIFVTAYADEMHTLKGYSYGAVDYILSPVVPDVLRTKVRVFIELYRLNQQVREQAARQIATSERERARLSAVLNRATDLFIQADAEGRIIQINPAGMRLLGCDEEHPAPATLADIGLQRPQLDAAMQDGVWFGDADVVTANDERVWVSQLLLAHMDEARHVESFSLIARDIRERKRAEQAKGHLAAIVESTDDAIISMTLEGVITTWNASAERLFGYTPEEAVGAPVTMLIPAERRGEERGILEEMQRGNRVEPFETVRVAKDGRCIDISLTVSPLRDADGCVCGASKVARDITVRKQNEAELIKHRSHLEELVRDRTKELQASHERLRLTDRLASIGTLAAGLGHDMGNLLLPIRARIASLETLNLPSVARDHIEAIKTAGEYLKRLSQGLRLFALDPTESMSGSHTELAAWWLDVEPFLRNALPKSTVLEADMPDDLPPISMPPHTFTQVIYNLVQNAGDSMGRRPQGRVHVSAQPGPDARSVVISVSDNGPGMSEEVRLRCMEPFFTTRTRGISTGLGLALVHGAVYNVKGKIEIDSTLGVGTSFRLTLPAASSTDNSAGLPLVSGEAWLELTDVRLSAYLTALLKGMGLSVLAGTGEPGDATRVIVLHAGSARMNQLKSLLSRLPNCRALVYGDRNGQPHDSQIIWLAPKTTPSQTRAALQEALRQTSLTMEVA